MENKEFMNLFITEKKSELINTVDSYVDLMPNLVNMINECVDIFEKHGVSPDDAPHTFKFIGQFISFAEAMDGIAKSMVKDD